MKNVTFNVLNSKNLCAALGHAWLESLDESDFEQDRDFLAMFIDDDIVCDELHLDAWNDPITDTERMMCAPMLTTSNAACVIDHEALGAALLDDPYIVWDEVDGMLAMVA